MDSREIADQIVSIWETIENESMRNGYRHTFIEIIAATLDKRCYTLPNGDCVTPICDLHK